MKTYGHDITQWEADYPGWRLSAGFEGFGYTATRRGLGSPRQVAGVTLDDLAEVIGPPPVPPGADLPG